MPDSPTNTADRSLDELRSTFLRWVAAVSVVTFCTYSPFSWLLWIEYPWNDYRWSWVRLWPILPGFVPTLFLQVRGDPWMWILAGFFSLMFVATLAWFAARNTRSLVLSASAALVLHTLNAFVAYQLFRA